MASVMLNYVISCFKYKVTLANVTPAFKAVITSIKVNGGWNGMGGLRYFCEIYSKRIGNFGQVPPWLTFSPCDRHTESRLLFSLWTETVPLTLTLVEPCRRCKQFWYI